MTLLYTDGYLPGVLAPPSRCASGARHPLRCSAARRAFGARAAARARRAEWLEPRTAGFAPPREGSALPYLGDGVWLKLHLFDMTDFACRLPRRRLRGDSNLDGLCDAPAPAALAAGGSGGGSAAAGATPREGARRARAPPRP